MFRLTDLHLYGVMAAAVAVAALGFQLFRRGVLRTRSGQAPALTPKPMSRALVPGGLLFGVGWAIAGTCPGTALAQIGEGHLAGLFTFAGVLVGAAMHGRIAACRAARAGRTGGCRPASHGGFDSARA